MLPKGTNVQGAYRGVLPNGETAESVGSLDNPVVLTIGDYRIPPNVSNALATMEPGQQRQVKAVCRPEGGKPTIASYSVFLASIERLAFLEEESLHGAECACGCHKLRQIL